MDNATFFLIESTTKSPRTPHASEVHVDFIFKYVNVPCTHTYESTFNKVHHLCASFLFFDKYCTIRQICVSQSEQWTGVIQHNLDCVFTRAELLQLLLPGTATSIMTSNTVSPCTPFVAWIDAMLRLQKAGNSGMDTTNLAIYICG